MKMMRFASTLFSAVALIAGCGGDMFVFSDASPEGAASPSDAAREAATRDGAAVDGASEAGSRTGLACGTITCTTSPICCIGPATSPSCTDINRGCGCNTRLACASDSDCTPTQPVCCIRSVTDATCMTGYNVATCSMGCSGGNRLCDPNNMHPCPGGMCSTSFIDLLAVGLPSGAGYGVCK